MEAVLAHPKSDTDWDRPVRRLAVRAGNLLLRDFDGSKVNGGDDSVFRGAGTVRLEVGSWVDDASRRCIGSKLDVLHIIAAGHICKLDGQRKTRAEAASDTGRYRQSRHATNARRLQRGVVIIERTTTMPQQLLGQGNTLTLDEDFFLISKMVSEGLQRIQCGLLPERDLTKIDMSPFLIDW